MLVTAVLLPLLKVALLPGDAVTMAGKRAEQEVGSQNLYMLIWPGRGG